VKQKPRSIFAFCLPESNGEARAFSTIQVVSGIADKRYKWERLSLRDGGIGFFYKTYVRFVMIKVTLTWNEENPSAIFGF
jgi:hypothetical protein